MATDLPSAPPGLTVVGSLPSAPPGMSVIQPATINSALVQVGVNPAADTLGQAIDKFAAQNLSPGQLSTVAQSLKDAALASLPTVLRVPPTAGTIDFKPQAGVWESIHYADDLIAHAPKFKFLFKVSFEGFGDSQFSFFVHRCDKPKVLMNHLDVNFYNFHTRVLTSVIYQPLSMTLLDETGNSVHNFFAAYLSKVSGTGSGNWGIDAGFGAASSTKPYEGNHGYSSGKRVVIEQIFANGIYSNLFELINPRIEAFDFDELNMEDSSTGSMLNLTLSYDALSCKTVKFNDSNTWGNTDILKGGGTAGVPNAGATSTFDGVVQAARSAAGAGMNGPSPLTGNNSFAEALIGQATNLLPASLRGLGGVQQLATKLKDGVSSAGDTLSRNIADTVAAVKGGFGFTRQTTLPTGDFARADRQASSLPSAPPGLSVVQDFSSHEAYMQYLRDNTTIN